MIYTPRSLLRSSSDLLIWAEIAAWWCDQPASRWWTLAEIEPMAPLGIETLQRLLNGWAEMGWLESKQDSGRTMWRPTPQMPIVEHRQQDDRQTWADMLSGRLSLGVR